MKPGTPAQDPCRRGGREASRIDSKGHAYYGSAQKLPSAEKQGRLLQSHHGADEFNEGNKATTSVEIRVTRELALP